MAAESAGIGQSENGRGQPRPFSLGRRLRVLAIWSGLGLVPVAWVQFQAPPPPVAPPELADVPGVRLLYRHECGRCHQVELPGMNGKMGPPLRNLAPRGRGYLEQSLLEPGKVVVRGYVNAMPSYAHLPALERQELVDYLMGL